MKKKRTNTSFFAFFKGFIAFILVSLSLMHVFFNDASQEYLNEKINYKKIRKERDSVNTHNLNLLKEGLVSSERYITLTEASFLHYKSQLKTSTNRKIQYARDFSFRGRNSFHFWIFVFGLVTALFYFACKSLFDEFSKGSTFKHQLVSISGIMISGFWFIHLIFLTQDDFKKHNYVVLILCCALLFAVFTYFLVKYYSYKDKNIYRLLDFIERVKTKHYYNLSIKAGYAEKYNEAIPPKVSVNQSIEEFQEDLKKSTAGI